MKYNVVLSVIFIFLTTFSAPILNKSYQFKQPDGTSVPVFVSGDEYYQTVTSIDGYTLVRDSNGWICYAELSIDKTKFIAKERYYGNTSNLRNIVKGITISKDAIATEVNKNRSLLDDHIDSRSRVAWKQPLGNVKGLTIMIDFSDKVGTVSKSEVEDFLNGSNYTSNSNNGSVKEWFDDVSRNTLNYTNVAYGYYRAAYSFSYYDDANVSYGTRAKELITEALNYMQSNGFDFSQLTDVGGTPALNVLYAGSPVNGWSKGLWPHKGSIYVSVGGKTFTSYQISDIGGGLELGTFIHENGHMLCGYPDLYPYSSGVPDQYIRGYCSMGYGSINNPKNPVPYNPYFRHMSGWYSPEDLSGITNRTITTNPNEVGDIQYVHNSGSTEAYYIDSRADAGRSSPLPNTGLIIWHVYTSGSNTSSSTYPLIEVVENDNNGSVPQAGDYFVNMSGYAFSSSTTPTSNWYNGSSSGLDIRNISSYSTNMTYDLGEGGSVVIDSFTVDITASNGTVTKSPDYSKYEVNTVVTLTANPTQDYEFSNWSGDTSATSNPLTITVTKNRSLTANFTEIIPDSATLSITADNGTVSSNPTGTKFLTGTTVDLTATPDETYFFVRWTGDCSGTDTNVSLSLDNNKSVTAEFYPISYPDTNMIIFPTWEIISEGASGTAGTIDSARLLIDYRLGASLAVAQDVNYESYSLLQANFNGDFTNLESIQVTYTASKGFSLELYDQGDTIPPVFYILDASETPKTVNIPVSELSTRVDWGVVNNTPLDLTKVSSIVFNVENSQTDDVASAGISGEIYINDIRLPGYSEAVPMKDIMLSSSLKYGMHIVNSMLYLSIPKSTSSSISLWTLSGKKIYSKKTEKLSSGIHSFNLGNFASGMYIIKVKTELGVLKQSILMSK